MNGKKTVFISDVHVCGRGDQREKAFLDFLESQASSLFRLVIVGDLFDFWVGYRTVVYHAYFPVLKRLLDLRHQGVHIDYIEGNHDFHLGPFFKDFLKCNVYPQEAIVQLDGLTIAISHGDLVNRKDYGHRFLRRCLRSSVAKFGLRVLHPDWIWTIANRVSRLSHDRHREEGQSEKVIGMYRKFAEDRLKHSDADVIILGHSHYPDEQVFLVTGDAKKDDTLKNNFPDAVKANPETKKKYYYNTGDWVTNFSYLEYDSGTFTLKKFIFDTAA